jgi:uncharacterized membrane protein YcaP (DUF421 family)
MEFFDHLIGTSAQTITWRQMTIRGIFIFLIALILVHFGGKRAFGKATSFDIVLGIILGSIMSRALIGNAPFFPAIAAAAGLVILHAILGRLAANSRLIGYLIKGREAQLVQDGEILWQAMRQSNITTHDLEEAFRMKGGPVDLSKVQAAYLERSGQISVLSKA